MQVERTRREFHYAGGLILPDPESALDVDAVRSVYAAAYPEITTAAVTGPEIVDGKIVYMFKAAVGTKG